VTSARIVEPLDVVEYIGTRLVSRSVDFAGCALGLELLHLALQLRDLGLRSLHPAVSRERFQRVVCQLLDPFPQQVLVHVDITRRRGHRDTPLAHEPDRLDLELTTESPPLHTPPPASL
jgi:hypothetical protein